MKIVIFEPHPDDLLFGPGPILLDWIEEEHEIHVITVTDGRACCRAGGDVFSPEIKAMSEDDIAHMRIEEARTTIKYLGIPLDNHHLLNFHDADGQKYVKEGIQKVKSIIKDADRLVFSSTNNMHEDHQAAHDIAIGAARELNLTDIEYFVFFIASYGRFQEDSKDKQFQFPISDECRKKLIDWYEIYKSMSHIKYTNRMYIGYLKKVETMTYGLFQWEDLGKYYNF
jgi:LmbE family N-acetylglucosaminyl deacetylase